MLKQFRHYLTNKKRNFSLKLDSKIFNSINEIINKSAGKKINLGSKKNLQQLKLKDIKKIDSNLRNKYQKELIKIIKPEIKKITRDIFDKEELLDFRVSPQCKYKKYLNLNNKKVEYKKIINLKDYNLPLNENVYCYQTKNHQDLSNNGFRSSMCLIFYFQLTNHFNDTCLMRNANFKNKSGLLNFDETKYYSNIINHNESKKLHWYIPKDMKPKRIYIMDSITPHNSSNVSRTPRLALNVKIQPQSLNYIYKIFNIKKRFKKNFEYNLNVLENDLKYLSNKVNSFNFELSVLYLLQKKFDKAFISFDKFTLSKFEQGKIKKIFAGAMYRKTYEAITSNDVKKVFQKDLSFSKLSCAESIMRTLKQ